MYICDICTYTANMYIYCSQSSSRAQVPASSLPSKNSCVCCTNISRPYLCTAPESKAQIISLHRTCVKGVNNVNALWRYPPPMEETCGVCKGTVLTLHVHFACRQLITEQIPTRQGQLLGMYGPSGSKPLLPDSQGAAPGMIYEPWLIYMKPGRCITGRPVVSITWSPELDNSQAVNHVTSRSQAVYST